MKQNRLKEFFYLAGSFLGLSGIVFLLGGHRLSHGLILPPAVLKMAWITLLTLFISGLLLFILSKLRIYGKSAVLSKRIIRYAQDSFPYYGNQLWAIEVTQLTRENYQEHRIGDIPILKGYENWNTRGMHHLSPLQLSDGSWISAVDGHGRQVNEW